MTRISASIGTILFFFVAPVVVAGIIPWWMTRWVVHASFPGCRVLQAVGALIIAAGLLVLIDAFVRFAVEGLGTPAPLFPTRHLVVRGFYRHVRNPMYVAVVATIVGQAMILGNIELLIYGALVWLACHLFVRFYEEPTLLTTFGADYDVFCANVPRWLPRLTPWQSPAGRPR